MDNLVAIAVGAAWLAIFVMLVWGIVSGLRRQLRDEGPLPFFAVLERKGLSVAQVEHAAGVEQLARAVGRCSLCEERKACGTRACPNDALLSRIR
jgi:ferredoxin